MSTSSYYKNLIQRVLDASISTTWEEAVREWEIIDCLEDTSCLSECVCGKQGIRYLFTIQNIKNQNKIYPIGSSCIKKFNRDDLSDEIAVYESKFKLRRAILNDERIELSSKYFTKKLILNLYESGAFAKSPYNNFNPRNDYEFLLDMYNKRNKSALTAAQRSKIRALIAYSIKPYLMRTLKAT